jgi:hypothetical protein
MSGIDLDTAQTHLDAWLAAELKVATGQEYEIDTGNGRRRLKRADLAQIREQIKYWRGEVSRLSGNRRRRGVYAVTG